MEANSQLDRKRKRKLSTEIFTSLVALAFFLLFLLLQTLFPRRDLGSGGLTRALHNLLLFLFNAVFMRLLAPFTLVLVSAWAAENGWGLFNQMALNQILVIAVCVIALDFAVYWQHVATHHFDILWRLHRVHHADQDMDVTTAVRFHPIELFLSLLYKAFFVLLLGAPVVAVVLFELLLFVGPAFNHSNVSLPTTLDRLLRWVIATPDVHRAHHSILVAEQNTNYGFFLIWWDRLFNTYTAEPQQGHESMQIGLEQEEVDFATVDRMLISPFR